MIIESVKRIVTLYTANPICGIARSLIGHQIESCVFQSQLQSYKDLLSLPVSVIPQLTILLYQYFQVYRDFFIMAIVFIYFSTIICCDNHHVQLLWRSINTKTLINK